MTDKKQNLLYIAHRIPYPPNKGDKIRTFHEIKYLSQFFHIDLVTFADTPSDMIFEANLKKYCRQVHVFPLNPLWGKIKGLKSLLLGKSIAEGYFFDTRANKKIAVLLKKNTYQAVFCFSSPTAEYVFQNLSDIPRKTTRLIMDFCDVDSDKWQQYAEKTRFPMNQLYRLEASRLLAYEKKINQSFDASIFVSENEADLFRQYVPEARNIVPVSNGVDFTYFSGQVPEKNNNESPTILFTGAMDYHANVDGVTWFAKKIFPLLKQRIPAIRFVIVGSNPRPAVTALAQTANITVTGYVDDIREYYQAADVSVVPLRIARGIQNKVLEAMAMGLPVVCTSAALSGIQAIPGKDVIQADDETAFADAVELLIKDKKLARKTADSAGHTVRTRYAWSACLEKLNPDLGVPSS
jgi:polysaccharide biosynthesis protein PslH